jgi:hypothetical protein
VVLRFLALLEYFDRGKDDPILHEFSVMLGTYL